MRAVMCNQFGPVEDLRVEERPDPVAGEEQVLVDVRAAGVSFVDGLVVRGKYQIKPPLPFTPGMVLAGEVISAGPGAGEWLPGEPVVGMAFGAAYASRAAVHTAGLVRVPDGVPLDIAASALESYGTMSYAFRQRARLEPGDWVLVLGAGGGIGLAAVDVARALGARVVAAASSPEKREAALRAGAEAVVDYRSEDLKSRVRELTGGGVDMVVDPVGGEFAEQALRTLRWSGRYLVVGFASGAIPSVPLNHVLLNSRSVLGIEWGAWVLRQPDANRALTLDVLAQVARGELKPPKPVRYPLDRAAEALAAIENREVTGKLVLVP